MELVEAVLDHPAQLGRPTLPAAQQRELEDLFGGYQEFLVAMHRRWYAAFGARLDAVLEENPADLPGAVAGMWDTLAAEQPGVRALLDAVADHPAIAAADARQARLLRWGTGVELRELQQRTQRTISASTVP